MQAKLCNWMTAGAAAIAMTAISQTAQADVTFLGQLHITNAVINEQIDIDFTSFPAPLNPYSSSSNLDAFGVSVSSFHDFNPTDHGFATNGSVEIGGLSALGGVDYIQGTSLVIAAFEVHKTIDVRVQGSVFGGQYLLVDGEIESGTVGGAVLLNQQNQEEFYRFLSPEAGGLYEFDQIITLGPGTYEIGFFAQGTTPLGGDYAWFNGSFSIVPAPGALAVFLMAAVGGRSRRRR